MRPVNLFASLYLLRILDPSDFGIVALAMLLLTTSNLFSDLGMGVAVIHSSYDRGKIAFQSFVTMMGFSGLFFVLVFTNTALFAELMGAPEIEPIIRWLSFYILIDTASTIPTSLLRKDLMFDKIGLSTFLSEMTLTVVQLVMALLGFGLWSLVVGLLMGSAVKTITSWWFCPGWDWIQPKRWDRTIQRSLLGYGMQATGSGIISYLHSHFDDWLIGRTLGSVALGFYSKAYDLTHSTMNRIGKDIIRVVFFPSYTKIRDDQVRLARAYIKSVKLVLIIMVPAAFGILASAPEIVKVLWGAKWAEMIPVLQIYAVAILTRPISENVGPLFQALGKPNFNMRAGLLLMAIAIPLSLLLLRHGITGVAIAVVIGHTIGMIYNVYQANTLVPGTARDTVKVMGSMLFIGALMGSVVFAAKLYALQASGGTLNFIGLILLVALGAIVYVTALFIWQRAFITEMFNIGLAVIGPKLKMKRFAPQR